MDKIKFFTGNHQLSYFMKKLLSPIKVLNSLKNIRLLYYSYVNSLRNNIVLNVYWFHKDIFFKFFFVYMKPLFRVEILIRLSYIENCFGKELLALVTLFSLFFEILNRLWSRAENHPKIDEKLSNSLQLNKKLNIL